MGRWSFLLGPIEVMACKIVAGVVVASEAFGTDVFTVDGCDVCDGDGVKEESASIYFSEFCLG